jgi:hypothetical protein
MWNCHDTHYRTHVSEINPCLFGINSILLKVLEGVFHCSRWQPALTDPASLRLEQPLVALIGLTTTKIEFVGFEVFTAVTMRNVVFWDIRIQFVPHRRHIMSPLQSPAG